MLLDVIGFSLFSLGPSQGRTPVAVNDNPGPAGRRRVRNRMTAGRRAPSDRYDDNDDFDDIDDDNAGVGGGFPFDDQMPTGKIGTKKLRKLEMKAEKRAMREVNYILSAYFLCLFIYCYIFTEDVYIITFIQG